MPRGRRSGKRVAVAVAALAITSGSGVSQACGSRGAGAGGGGGGGGPRASSGGSWGGTVGGSSGSHGSGSCAGANLLAGLGALGAAVAPYLELQGGWSWQSLDGSTLRWTGWQGHPVLGAQMGFAGEAPGRALGFGRMTMMGATARVSALVGGFLTIGGSAGYLAQVNGAADVNGSTGVFRARGAQGVEAGGEINVIAAVGRLRIRGGMYAGARHLWSTVDGLGYAGCDSVPVVLSTQPVVAPRVQFDAQITRNFSFSTFVGMDLLRPGDVMGGVVFSLHGHGFSTLPEETAPAVTSGSGEPGR